MRALLIAAAFLACVATTALGADNSELRAFQRDAQPGDAIAMRLHEGFVADSRRIAVYTDTRGRRFTLYVAKTDRGWLCAVLRRPTGSGSGCSPRDQFFRPRSHGVYMSGRHFVGVTTNDVASVVLIGSRGARHRVPVTRDGGFIYNCRAYNGCASLIACVQSYDGANKLLGSERVMGGRCPTRRR